MSKHTVGVKENQGFKNLDTKLQIWWKENQGFKNLDTKLQIWWSRMSYVSTPNDIWAYGKTKIYEKPNIESKLNLKLLAILDIKIWFNYTCIMHINFYLTFYFFFRN